jgi:hypothetical protein
MRADANTDETTIAVVGELTLSALTLLHRAGGDEDELASCSMASAATFRAMIGSEKRTEAGEP